MKEENVRLKNVELNMRNLIPFGYARKKVVVKLETGKELEGTTAGLSVKNLRLMTRSHRNIIVPLRDIKRLWSN